MPAIIADPPPLKPPAALLAVNVGGFPLPGAYWLPFSPFPPTLMLNVSPGVEEIVALKRPPFPGSLLLL